MKKGKEDLVYSKKTGERKDANIEALEDETIEANKEQPKDLEADEAEQIEDGISEDS